MTESLKAFLPVILVFLTSSCAVKVSIYYESMCPDSTKFIARQLQPHILEIANYTDLDLVPYGKAAHSEVNGTWEFLCQHGSRECQGNKYQACALSLKSGAETDVAFVSCIMRSRTPYQLSSVLTCAKRYHMDTESIKSCSTSSTGDKLLAANGDRTPPIAFVPTIIYDDVFDQVAQDQSLKDFVAVLCSKLEETKPSVCDNRTLPKIHAWRLF